MRSIILDCDLMKHPNSGLYHYCLNLGREVNSLIQEKDDLKMTMFVPEAEKNTFGSDVKSVVDKKWVWNFLKPVEKNCVLWHAPFQSGRIVPDKKRWPSIKVLLTIHDLNVLHEGKPAEEQRKSLAHTQQLINRADALVCISQFTREDVQKNLQVENKPVYVIYNGIHAIGKSFLNSSSYQPVRPFLFGMGYINRKKNYHVLLPLLKNKDVELVLAGRLDEPAYVDYIYKMALEMNVAERLHITGPISENEKAWYYENCMAFVHPSLAEGFGAPVAEVMQFGKPIFLSSLTSLPEIGGDAAFYFHSFEGDQMCNTFSAGMQKFLGNGMAEKVKQRATIFNWKKQAAEYLALYKHLAG